MKTILFSGGPFDGLVVEAAKYEDHPFIAPTSDCRLIRLYRPENGMWWEYCYLVRGSANVAVYSHANNQPHVLAVAEETKPDEVVQAARRISAKAEVASLIRDPRTFTP